MEGICKEYNGEELLTHHGNFVSIRMDLCLVYLGKQTWKSEMVNEDRKKYAAEDPFCHCSMIRNCSNKKKNYSVHILARSLFILNPRL